MGCLFCLFDFLTSSTTTRLYCGRIPRLKSDNFICCHIRDPAGRPWLLSQPITLYWHRPNQWEVGGHGGDGTHDLMRSTDGATAPPSNWINKDWGSSWSQILSYKMLWAKVEAQRDNCKRRFCLHQQIDSVCKIQNHSMPVLPHRCIAIS